MVQQVVKTRTLPCRMVGDSLNRTVVQDQKQDHIAETKNQSQAPKEPAEPEQEHIPQGVEPESQEPSERQLSFQEWSKLHFKEENQRLTGADGNNFPTHLRPFSSPEEYSLVKDTYQQLQQSGYYWGPMTMEAAHERLTHKPLGTFLIRDSGQSDVFFTLSYHSDDGPTSVRIQLNKLQFSLHGSQRTFASLFTLLAHYTSSSCKLTEPYRRQRPESLKQLCRRAFICTYGAECLKTLPGLNPQVKAFVCAYPHCI
ncbi:suppressor of cytokine signaling 1-like [Pholidichthys leucotaenia]